MQIVGMVWYGIFLTLARKSDSWYAPIYKRLCRTFAIKCRAISVAVPNRDGDNDFADGFFCRPAVAQSSNSVAERFVGLLTGQSRDEQKDIAWMDANWQTGMVPMTIETLRFTRKPSLHTAMLKMLSENTGQLYGDDIDAWYRWLWSQPEQRHPEYAQFKSLLYRNLDPIFAGYFNADRETTVRLDEIRWGGVKQDGIPPLRYPAMIAATEADYLTDTDVVFGLEYDGDARAYPKRILAWHEMFVDKIAGAEYAGVYSTLSGAVIMYNTQVNGVTHALGTSGFLYRSNKVMYDKATQSLWNTTYGESVVGPLVGQGIALQRSFLVTSTWGE